MAGGLELRYFIIRIVACEFRPHPRGLLTAIKTVGCKNQLVRLAVAEECQDIQDLVFLLYKNTNKVPLGVYVAQWFGEVEVKGEVDPRQATRPRVGGCAAVNEMVCKMMGQLGFISKYNTVLQFRHKPVKDYKKYIY